MKVFRLQQRQTWQVGPEGCFVLVLHDQKGYVCRVRCLYNPAASEIRVTCAVCCALPASALWRQIIAKSPVCGCRPWSWRLQTVIVAASTDVLYRHWFHTPHSSQFLPHSPWLSWSDTLPRTACPRLVSITSADHSRLSSWRFMPIRSRCHRHRITGRSTTTPDNTGQNDRPSG